MQLLSQLIFVKKKIKNINDNGLKTAILRVSKKWEGGGEEGAFVTANCSRRLETIVSIF